MLFAEDAKEFILVVGSKDILRVQKPSQIPATVLLTLLNFGHYILKFIANIFSAMESLNDSLFVSRIF